MNGNKKRFIDDYYGTLKPNADKIFEENAEFATTPYEYPETSSHSDDSLTKNERASVLASNYLKDNRLYDMQRDLDLQEQAELRRQEARMNAIKKLIGYK